MTNATTRTRQRKAKATAQALMPRGQLLIDQGADMLILSARMAETPVPVFWAEGELDARTTLAVHAGNDWDGHYEHADVGGGYHWDWYRAARLADELEAVPVVTVTVAAAAPPVVMPGTPMLQDEGLDAKVAALMAIFDAEDGSIPQEPPGPAVPPSVISPRSPREGKGSPAGPGSPPDDPALDKAPDA